MSNSRSTLLHGNWNGSNSAPIEPPSPATTAPSANNSVGDRLLTSVPTLSNSERSPSQLVAQIAQDSKNRLTAAGITQPLKFKVHSPRGDNERIRIRRYARHFTVSLDIRLLKAIETSPAKFESTIGKIVYRVIHRSCYPSFPLADRPSRLGIFLFGFLSALCPLLVLTHQYPLATIFGLLGALGLFLSVMETCAPLIEPRRPVRYLFRQVGEKQTRHIIMSDADAYDQLDLLNQIVDSNQRQNARLLNSKTKDILSAEAKTIPAVKI